MYTFSHFLNTLFSAQDQTTEPCAQNHEVGAHQMLTHYLKYKSEATRKLFLAAVEQATLEALLERNPSGETLFDRVAMHTDFMLLCEVLAKSSTKNNLISLSRVVTSLQAEKSKRTYSSEGKRITVGNTLEAILFKAQLDQLVLPPTLVIYFENTARIINSSTSTTQATQTPPASVTTFLDFVTQLSSSRQELSIRETSCVG